MKNLYTTISIFAMVVLLSSSLKAQLTSVNFENFQLSIDTFDDGKYNTTGYFESGNATFYTKYDTSFGGFWSQGFAISSMRDSITEGYMNMFSSISANGNNSQTYAVGQYTSTVKIPSKVGTGLNAVKLKSVYFNNSTYAYHSIQKGDFVAKKFGGVSGNDSDWFKVSVIGFYKGESNKDTLDFYLADFRFENNSEDYIIRDWTKFDLTALDTCDSIQFVLSSSDNGQWGMNTPAYFCLDNLEYEDISTGLANLNSDLELTIFPCPAYDNIFIDTHAKIESISIMNYEGKEILTDFDQKKIEISSLTQGLYFINIKSENGNITKRFVKL